MKVVAIVQARMGSTRFPGKVMQLINGKPLLQLLCHRLEKSKNVDQIVIAIPENEEDDELANLSDKLGYVCVRGSETDVLNRFYEAAKKTSADIIVRITGDCPVIDPRLIDSAISEFKGGEFDYFSNCNPATYPDGLDVEVFSFKTLEKCFGADLTRHEREHVTPAMRRTELFSVGSMRFSQDLSALRWTVDEYSDFDVIKNVYDHFSPKLDFSWEEILELQRTNPEIFRANAQLSRNQGEKLGTGQKLWKRAKNVIPGGNMLLSKRPEMFLPDRWPAYFSRAKGCKVWDLDGKEYIDMSTMGVGTNTLGYGHEEVDEAVRSVVGAGNMSTLNAAEELYLAERLIALHEWADMARFARTGGEANAIAIRIARAATGKDKVAVCGYHGWHDWYLAANLSEDGLADHLIPGLEPLGVPKRLKDTTYPFLYGDIEALRNLVREHDIGVIKMEVQRNEAPNETFLRDVRKLASENQIVLIFDECTSGFRETFGGLHKKYDIEPDMAIFGKALGNGYAVTAIIGKGEILSSAQNSFISSTFWTERIGSAAALKTLEIMETEESWSTITGIGKKIKLGWSELANKYEIELVHWGIPALAGFTIKSEYSLQYKTLVTQEMLKRGFLAANSVYSCIDHSRDVLNQYFDALDPVFELIGECEQGRPVEDLLDGPVCHQTFRRLN